MTVKTNTTTHYTNTKRLSVQISLTGLSFFILDTSSQQEITTVVRTLQSDYTPEQALLAIQDAFREETVLKEPFNDVTLIYATQLYTIVPQSLFDETRASEYLKFNSKILATDFIAHDTLKTSEIVSVYIPFININNYFFERFGGFRYYHSSSLLLKQLLEKENATKEPLIYIHVAKSSFDMIVVENRSLKLCNTYLYKTKEDFIYYILFCMEQLQLDSDRIPVHLFGNIHKQSPLYDIVFKYVRNTSIVTISDFNIPENRSTKDYNMLHLLV